jgi:hypothetical protein
VYELKPSTQAPDADLALHEIYFVEGVSKVDLSLSNRGGVTLELLGLSTEDPRFTFEVDQLSAAPGDNITITIHFENDGAPVDGSLCVVTNDSDESVQNVTLASTSEGSSVLVGQPAPNFILPDLEGNYAQLSDQLGHPVVLCYFATW